MSQGKHVDLGFGCMRLPLLRADQPESFDYEKIERLFDVFLKKGFTYFDTAYTYHGSWGGGCQEGSCGTPSPQQL